MMEKCECSQLSARSCAPLSPWDDFNTAGANGVKPKENTSKGRKQSVTRSRYGYETLEDRYRFSHHENIEQYIEDYRDIFAVSNRANKKPWKPNGMPYNLLRMAPPVRARYVPKNQKESRIAESPTVRPDLEECEDPQQAPFDLAEEEDTTPATVTPSVQLGVREQVTEESCSEPIDEIQDSFCDQSEDDKEPEVEPKIPLVAQLDTFFSSRNSRRSTPACTSNSSNLFPHIYSSPELGEMTASTIINYKIPTTQERHRPTSHPKLTIQKAMDNRQQAMFKPMFQRQKIQMFPMRTKSINASNLNHYDQLHSGMQTANHKRFSPLILQRELPESKGLPKTHILTAKTINRTFTSLNDTKPSKSKEGEMMVHMSQASDIPTRSLTGQQERKPSHKHTYEPKSLHLLPSSYSPVDRNFGRAELVDYSTGLAGEYRH